MVFMRYFLLILIASLGLGMNAKGQELPIPLGSGFSSGPVGVPYYVSSLTVNHTKCGTANSTNFTVLVSITDARFKNTVNGGHVNGSRWNFEFYSNAADTTSLLSWEIESYDSTTGKLIAWVEMPHIYVSTDVVFYCRYGMNWVTTNHTAGIPWNSNYKMVMHFADAGSLLADWTGNGNSGTNSGCIATGAEIGNGVWFNGTSNYFTSPAIYNVTNGTTNNISFWINPGCAAEPIIFDCNNSSVDAMQLGSGCGTIYPVWGAGPSYIQFAAITGGLHFITLQKNGTGNTGIMYVDGVPLTALTGSMGDYVTASDMFWGVYKAFTNYYAGIIDELEMENTNDSQSSITAKYNMISSPSSFMTLGTETH